MSTNPPVREMIKEAVIDLGGTAEHSQIRDWINSHYTGVNEKTILAQTIACTVNQISRLYYPENQKPRSFDPRYDVFFSPRRGEVTLYDLEKHGKWEIVEHDGKLRISYNGHLENEQNLEFIVKKFKENRQAFNPSRPNLEEIEKLRYQFVTDFSKEKIAKMTLEEYAEGLIDPITNEKRTDSFSYRIVNKMPYFGSIENPSGITQNHRKKISINYCFWRKGC
jgi:hypothetical protein